MASLCFATVLINFCFYSLLFSFYVCLVSKTCELFDRKKKTDIFCCLAPKFSDFIVVKLWSLISPKLAISNAIKSE